MDEVATLSVPSLYSTARFRLTEREPISFFQFAQAECGQGFGPTPLTRAHTNLKEGSRTLGARDFRVRSLALEILEGSDAGAAALRECGVLFLDLPQTELAIAPLGAFTWSGSSGFANLHRVVEIKGAAKFRVRLNIEDAPTSKLRPAEMVTLRITLSGDSSHPELWGATPEKEEYGVSGVSAVLFPRMREWPRTS